MKLPYWFWAKNILVVSKSIKCIITDQQNNSFHRCAAEIMFPLNRPISTITPMNLAPKQLCHFTQLDTAGRQPSAPVQHLNSGNLCFLFPYYLSSFNSALSQLKHFPLRFACLHWQLSLWNIPVTVAHFGWGWLTVHSPPEQLLLRRNFKTISFPNNDKDCICFDYFFHTKIKFSLSECTEPIPLLLNAIITNEVDGSILIYSCFISASLAGFPLWQLATSKQKKISARYNLTVRTLLCALP